MRGENDLFNWLTNLWHLNQSTQGGIIEVSSHGRENLHVKEKHHCPSLLLPSQAEMEQEEEEGRLGEGCKVCGHGQAGGLTEAQLQYGSTTPHKSQQKVA